MYRRIRIRNFRGLREVSVEDRGRENLVVQASTSSRSSSGQRSLQRRLLPLASSALKPIADRLPPLRPRLGAELLVSEETNDE